MLENITLGKFSIIFSLLPKPSENGAAHRGDQWKIVVGNSEYKKKD
ncbi:hypothetical protein ACTGVN_07065 [Streptococcus suis]